MIKNDGQTILVVDDVEETLDGSKEMLTSDGYRVYAARDERDAGADANVGGQAIMAYERLQRSGQHNLEYGTRARQVLTVAKPRVAAGIVVAGVFALGKLIEKVAGKSGEN